MPPVDGVSAFHPGAHLAWAVICAALLRQAARIRFTYSRERWSLLGTAEAIARYRGHHFSKRIIGVALYEFVTRCHICGRKALYLSGDEGRCSGHRFVVESHAQARRDRIDRNSDALEAAHVAEDRRLLALQRVRQTAKFGRKGRQHA